VGGGVVVRSLPYLGEALPEWMVWVCGYSPLPGEIVCGRDAAWHGLVLDDPAESVVAVMECCDEHLPRMKLTADFIHRLKHPCGIPGSRFRWPENECYTDWDEAAELGAWAELAGTR
jgi:hypothetical protein